MRRQPDEDMSYLELVTLPSAPFWARRHTRATLHAWQQCPETIETAELLVSEITTNAINASDHGDLQRISLTLRLLPGRIIIEVFDTSPSPPVLADTGPDTETGRGLILIQALSKEWGHYFPPAGGKVVYSVLSTPGTTTIQHTAAGTGPRHAATS